MNSKRLLGKALYESPREVGAVKSPRLIIPLLARRPMNAKRLNVTTFISYGTSQRIHT